jgi:hypothetical protein
MEHVKAAARLAVTHSNFAAAIRQCQMAGMNNEMIGSMLGLSAHTTATLIALWGLNT